MFSLHDNERVYVHAAGDTHYRNERIFRHRKQSRGAERNLHTAPVDEAVRAYRATTDAQSQAASHRAINFMKQPVLTVLENSRLAGCYSLLAERNVRQVPVVNDQDKPVGMLSMENMLKVLLIEGDVVRYAAIDSIEPLIERPLITATPDSDIRTIAQLMHERRLNCIPLTDDDQTLVGIITRADIIHAVAIYRSISLHA